MSCVDALVCCVVAESSSADAEDCSATAATSRMSARRAGLVGDLLDGGRDLLDAAANVLDRGVDALEGLARRSTVATPSAVRRRRRRRRRRRWPVSAWISPISAPIWPAAACDSSASLRTSSATTAKPRPCSPARAASMAALRASRLVCSAIAVIVVTIPPMRARALGQVLDRGADLAGGFGHLADRVGGVAGGFGALARRPARVSAASEVAGAVSALVAAAPATSCTAPRVDSTIRTWRSAPGHLADRREASHPRRGRPRRRRRPSRRTRWRRWRPTGELADDVLQGGAVAL